MQLLDGMVIACLVYKALTNCFLERLYHVTIPIVMYEYSSFSTSSHLALSLLLLLIFCRSYRLWLYLMVLICISPMANDVEHLRLSVYPLCVSVHFFCPLFDWVAIFFLLSFESSLYILDIIHLSDTWFANIFSQSVNCLLFLFIKSFAEQKFLIAMRSNLSIFFFCLGHAFIFKSTKLFA